eukprot:CAMPEP_0115277194 /NCGR_PEP_ID=MMETSP0270-20121206/57110_1 /TAXON_ID=71861 /ORGANISM="Scrippsiella trochoidea, Strain CCMP3099" /LENGTH=130 /DNA_ID=CAMNT_0002693819 /DNA_START=101 /DNA_END=493 /DNA_ORIENTATION=-
MPASSAVRGMRLSSWMASKSLQRFIFTTLPSAASTSTFFSKASLAFSMSWLVASAFIVRNRLQNFIVLSISSPTTMLSRVRLLNNSARIWSASLVFTMSLALNFRCAPNKMSPSSPTREASTPLGFTVAI